MFRNGGYFTLAPCGYRNAERRVDDPSRSRTGRDERWIEPGPEQFKVWKLAWELLLTNQYTLAEICEELRARSYTYRSGRPFVTVKASGKRKTNKNTFFRAGRT